MQKNGFSVYCFSLILVELISCDNVSGHTANVANVMSRRPSATFSLVRTVQLKNDDDEQCCDVLMFPYTFL